MSGGAAMPQVLMAAFEERFGIPVLEGDGPTECSPVTCVNPRSGPRKPGSVGLPIPRVEMRIEDRDGSTQCVYGGAVKVEELSPKADYLMFADTRRWQEMGADKYGPMKAMMFGRLKFKGPKGEAMNNMGPFGNFLVLTGQVPSNAEVCP